MTKKLLLASLVAAALPAFASTDLPESCKQYEAAMEAALKKDNAYSEDAMKVVRDQIAALPADQRDSVCKSGVESMNSDAKEDAKEEAEEKEEKEEAK